jgi:hypothetical protein
MPTQGETIMPKPLRKPRAYVVRLEWPSTIAWVDVAVMARSVQGAIKAAHRNVDYDKQDTYDDCGEIYVGAVAQVRSAAHAIEIVENRDLWDIPHLKIPRADRQPDEQAYELEEQVQFLRTALANAHTALAQSRAGTLDQAALDNHLNKASYVLANVH